MGSLKIKKTKISIKIIVSNKQERNDSIDVNCYIEYLGVMIFAHLLYFGTKVFSSVIKFIYIYRG